MKQTGPPKKPSALKILQGTFRQDRAPRNEARPKVEIPDLPAHLTDEAALEWVRVSEELAKLGLISRIDRGALAAYCDAWAIWVYAREMINRPPGDGGGLVIKSPTGYLVQSPWVSIADKAAVRIHKFCTEFGMTPASRSRIEAAPAAPPDDKPNRWKGFGG